MQNKKTTFLLLLVILALAALYPSLSRHPIHLFVLKSAEETVEAFKLSVPLNGREVTVEAVPLNPSQKKAGGEILAQKDGQRLVIFAKDFGVFPAVIGIGTAQEGWPGFLGGGFKGLFTDTLPGCFDNLQWTDRLYLTLYTKVPPPAPYSAGTGNEAVIPATTPVPFTIHASVTTNPVPTPGVVRVEILNGCGITNAADWVARRVKGSGITITDTGNADNFRYTKTIVRSCAGTPVALEEAVERLGLPKEAVEEIPSLSSSVDVVIIVGKDYRKLREQFRERNRH